MSLVKCHECGKEVSTEAKTCPSCGAKVKIPNPEKPAEKQKTSLLTWILLFTIILTVVVLSQESKERDTVTPEQRAAQAKHEELMILAKQCTKAIKASIKFPEDAQIPNPYSYSDQDKFFTEEKDGIYRVQVTFFARNAFNALKKSVVECRWQKNGGDYHSVGFEQLD